MKLRISNNMPKNVCFYFEKCSMPIPIGTLDFHSRYAMDSLVVARDNVSFETSTLWKTLPVQRTTGSIFTQLSKQTGFQVCCAMCIHKHIVQIR